MQNSTDQSDAKRTLLDKCLRGEIAFGAVTSRAQTGPPPAPSPAQTSQGEAAHQPKVSAPEQTDDTTESKPCLGVPIKVEHRSVVRQGLNRFVHLLCRFGPGGTTLRPFLHRMRGVRVGKNVWIGDDVYIDNEFPECIEIQDGAMIELRSTILAHTHGAGKVIIGKNAFIGAGAIVVTAGDRTLVIGEGSVIMASSLVTGSVPAYTLYGPDASKPLARVTRPFTSAVSYEEFMTSLRPLPR